MIIDSHCHVSSIWYEPVESLLFQMDQNGVEQAVLVQMMGQFDNSYQSECLRKYPNRFASVVLVDANRFDALRTLERLIEQGASGVRLRPTTRSPGNDTLAIWRAAENLGAAVSCSGTLSEFASEDFVHVISAVPTLRIVLEHLGSVNHPNAEPGEYEMRKVVYSLARFPNIYIKVHGLGEFTRRAFPLDNAFPFERPIPPFLDLALSSFGPQRMMWGSDYPPVSGREGYRNALLLTMEQLAPLSEAERDLIFEGTARSVFPCRTMG